VVAAPALRPTVFVVPDVTHAASDASERALREVRAVVARVLGAREATVYLFGSFAAGTQRRTSDIDIAIESETPLPRALLAKLRDALEESRVPYRVDVVDLAEASAELRERVRRTGRVWIERASA
jgi:predicted nucleotidyltransferase